MPYYSDDILEEVRAANDIVDVISGYVHLEKRGSRYVGLCPFHNDRNPSMSVSRENQTYYCYGCHSGGSVFSFVMEYENFSFPEAVQNLAERAHIELPGGDRDFEKRRDESRRTKLLEINREAATYFYSQLRSPQGRHALEYFKKRGLTSETMRKFGLGYSNKSRDDLYQYLKQKGYSDDLLKDSGLIIFDEKLGGRDRFWNRAMFPIMDTRNRVIGFGGRVMGDGEPKYVNSPETPIFTKGKNLYGLNFARRSRRPGILLCEGYMDVISLNQSGFDNAVAALGTAFTSEHANELRKHTQKVYLTLDNDEPGIRAALRTIPILKDAGMSVRIVDLTPFNDPDEFIKARGVEEYQKRIDGAGDSFMFEVHVLRQDYDLDDPEGNTEFFHRVGRMLNRFGDDLERDNYIRAVCREYNIDYDLMRKIVRDEARNIDRKPASATADRAVPDSRKKEDTVSPSQSLLLTWMAVDPAVFDAASEYVGPEDFTDEICRMAAEEAFAEHSGGTVSPARIVDRFSDEDIRSSVAGVFSADIPSDGNPHNRRKALNEAVRRVKLESLESRSAQRDRSDLAEMQRLIEERKRIENIDIKIN